MTKSKKKRNAGSGGASYDSRSSSQRNGKGGKDSSDDDDLFAASSSSTTSSASKSTSFINRTATLLVLSIAIVLLAYYFGRQNGWLDLSSTQPSKGDSDRTLLESSSSEEEKKKEKTISTSSASSNVDKTTTTTTTKTTKKKKNPDLPPEMNMSANELVARAKKQPCKDRKDQQTCVSMARMGNCRTAPGWMAVMCPAMCARCDLLDPKIRCSPENMNISGEPAYQPGDMNKMFESKIGLPNVKVMHKGEPWILLIEDFVSEVESKTLIELTEKELQRSTDQGQFDEAGVQEQVVSQSRTSSNAWCGYGCEENATVVNLLSRISDFVHVPVDNFESFQVLRYDKTQRYDRHHDASANDFMMPAGPRMLTFFLYLSDVEEGGETHFPFLNDLKVKPKKGAALLWPSIHSDNLGKIEQKTAHAALPVIKGIKRAANSWLHLKNYRAPNLWGCTGSFA